MDSSTGSPIILPDGVEGRAGHHQPGGKRPAMTLEWPTRGTMVFTGRGKQLGSTNRRCLPSVQRRGNSDAEKATAQHAWPANRRNGMTRSHGGTTGKRGETQAALDRRRARIRPTKNVETKNATTPGKGHGRGDTNPTPASPPPQEEWAQDVQVPHYQEETAMDNKMEREILDTRQLGETAQTLGIVRVEEDVTVGNNHKTEGIQPRTCGEEANPNNGDIMMGGTTPQTLKQPALARWMVWRVKFAPTTATTRRRMVAKWQRRMGVVGEIRPDNDINYIYLVAEEWKERQRRRRTDADRGKQFFDTKGGTSQRRTSTERRSNRGTAQGDIENSPRQALEKPELAGGCPPCILVKHVQCSGRTSSPFQRSNTRPCKQCSMRPKLAPL